MNPQELIDRFCDSPRRWLIVTAVTFVVAIVTLLPQVDQYLAARADEDEQSEKLAEAGIIAEELPGFRERVADTTTQLDALVERTLPADRVAPFRNQVVNLIRESGCQMRRISVGAVRSRAWRENDHPLIEGKHSKGKETPFSLETRAVSLSVTGNMTEIRQLLSRIESNGMMMHARTLDIRPTSRGAGLIQADLELWCFALNRSKQRT